MSLDSANSAFWDEMCGSEAARLLGITGNDPESLKRFDDWYFSHYPYLDHLIGFDRVKGFDVLEVGLGYGSVSQKLAESGARLTALDIAAGPVAGVRHRLEQNHLPGQAVQGSILEAPFPERSFDVLISIGCIHHTGNIGRALDETARLLRPGGRAVIMIYNATSYLHWIRRPHRVCRYLYKEAKGHDAPFVLDTAGARFELDQDTSGNAPPYTAALSKAHFAKMLESRFDNVRVRRVNAIAHRPFQFIPRKAVLLTVGPILGLDLYATFNAR